MRLDYVMLGIVIIVVIAALPLQTRGPLLLERVIWLESAAFIGLLIFKIAAGEPNKKESRQGSKKGA